MYRSVVIFFFQAEDGIRDADVTGVQTCALPICCGIAAAAARLSLGVTADVVSAVVSAASMQVAVPAACPIPWAGFGPAAVAGTDPLLVARRHVDFLRIRSAI